MNTNEPTYHSDPPPLLLHRVLWEVSFSCQHLTIHSEKAALVVMVSQEYSGAEGERVLDTENGKMAHYSLVFSPLAVPAAGVLPPQLVAPRLLVPAAASGGASPRLPAPSAG